MGAEIDLDVEFGRAVASIGGLVLSKVPKGTFSGKNADFLFPGDKVIAELKCLVNDRISDTKALELASQHYAEALRRKEAAKIAFGTVYMTTDGFTDDFRKKIMSIYAVPILRAIREADKQIRATKVELQLADHLGMLLIANDGNMAVDPSHMVEILSDAFSDPQRFPHINYVVFFTANLSAELDGYLAYVWVPAGRIGHPEVESEFERRLRTAWLSHHADLMGEPIREFDADWETMPSLVNRKNQ
jgi:hypothetical protein